MATGLVRRAFSRVQTSPAAKLICVRSHASEASVQNSSPTTTQPTSNLKTFQIYRWSPDNPTKPKLKSYQIDLKDYQKMKRMALSGIASHAFFSRAVLETKKMGKEKTLKVYMNGSDCTVQSEPFMWIMDSRDEYTEECLDAICDEKLCACLPEGTQPWETNYKGYLRSDDAVH